MHCCSCGKGELDDIYRQRGHEPKITGCIGAGAYTVHVVDCMTESEYLGPCMDYCTRIEG